MSRLEVITGPMFSGKTEELLRRISREEIAGRKVIIFKPRIDTRYSESKVKSHNGAEKYCFVVDDSYKIHELLTNSFEDVDVVGIDEAQFFDSVLVDVVVTASYNNKKVIISGLDKDFSLENFGSIPRLMVLADRVDKLTAVCNKCGSDDASFTQRLVGGKPANFDGPTILVGGTESYEARCRDCFEEG